MNKNKDTGNKGEKIAANYLVDKGFIIEALNWRFKHWEVDIFASNKNTLHCIEVKTRTSYLYGNPEESIHQSKMNALKNAAEEYLLQHPQWKNLQFDVISIALNDGQVSEIFMLEDVYF